MACPALRKVFLVCHKGAQSFTAPALVSTQRGANLAEGVGLGGLVSCLSVRLCCLLTPLCLGAKAVKVQAGKSRDRSVGVSRREFVSLIKLDSSGVVSAEFFCAVYEMSVLLSNSYNQFAV